MSPFVPPYPERPKEALSLLATIAAARRNFLAMFEDKCFEYQFFSTRMLARRVFVCNSQLRVGLRIESALSAGKIGWPGSPKRSTPSTSIIGWVETGC